MIYTDIAKDGMLEGPNYSALTELLNLLECNLIASGGVSSPNDIFGLPPCPASMGQLSERPSTKEKLCHPSALEIIRLTNLPTFWH